MNTTFGIALAVRTCVERDLDDSNWVWEARRALVLQEVQLYEMSYLQLIHRPSLAILKATDPMSYDSIEFWNIKRTFVRAEDAAMAVAKSERIRMFGGEA